MDFDLFVLINLISFLIDTNKRGPNKELCTPRVTNMESDDKEYGERTRGNRREDFSVSELEPVVHA